MLRFSPPFSTYSHTFPHSPDLPLYSFVHLLQTLFHISYCLHAYSCAARLLMHSALTHAQHAYSCTACLLITLT
jgi:hypothetical protein